MRRTSPISLVLTLTIALTAVSRIAAQDAEQEAADPVDLGVPSIEVDDDTALLKHCDVCCPCWTVRAGVVHWWRDQTSNVPILVDGFIPEFEGNEFDFMESPAVSTDLNQLGLDISLRHDDGCGRGTELRYLRIYATSRPVYNAAGPVSPATNPATNFTSTGAWNLDLDSEGNSLELLQHYCGGGLDVSYGFRYFNLDEQLLLDPPGATLFAFDAENNLYGFQIGVDGSMWDSSCSGLSLDASAKAGVYYNDARASASSTALPGAPTAVQGSTSEDHISFVGELGLTAVYEASCNLSLRAGYRLVVFDGVALAPDQVANTGNLGVGAAAVAPVSVDLNTLFYHGVQLGIEYRR